MSGCARKRETDISNIPKSLFLSLVVGRSQRRIQWADVKVLTRGVGEGENVCKAGCRGRPSYLNKDFSRAEQGR